MLKFFLIDVDAWEDVDPDELSYEELLALGEAVGTESRGLSIDTIASLPFVNYKTVGDQHGSNDSYVQTLCDICRVDYDDGKSFTVLTPTVRMTLWLMGTTLGLLEWQISLTMSFVHHSACIN
ncbi:unnamed protein product [Lupinus luteus]|uniref:Uncharacterized protein n=1 Tax=Lupinus luteus TaxID=3873 RepID=A0AAV1Y468_LUPLU